MVGGEVSGPTLILDDTLYAAGLTAIETYTVSPGPGAAWILLSAQGMSVSTTGVSAASSGGSLAINGDSVSDVEIIIDLTTGSTAATRVAGVGRVDSSSNGYVAQIDGAGGLGIRRFDRGVSMSLSTASCGNISATTTYTLKFRAVGSLITATLLDGATEVCSPISYSSDTTYTSGSPAIRILNTASRITDIKAYEQ